MKKNLDLTEGPIASRLIKLSIPIMLTSFIQTAYNITDMFFIGKNGSIALSAVGTAAFFTNFAMALVFITKTGAEVKVAQSTGMKDEALVKNYIKTSIQVNVLLSLMYTLILLLFNKYFIGFFNFTDNNLITMSRQYMTIVALGLIFFSINPVFTAIFNGSGDSITPFVVNTLGLILNVILDKLLIFGVGPIPALNVVGAALATIIAQFSATMCFVLIIVFKKDKRFKQNYFSKINLDYLKNIGRLGLPAAFQKGLFTVFAILIGKIIASYGTETIAVQKLGSQIESISWMTAGGFSTALSSFVGQNFGAKKYDRIAKGYKATIGLAIVVGIFTSSLLIFGGETIFKFFSSEPKTIQLGGEYLTILGFSQLFMCTEITTTGAFNGFGRTEIPSAISIVFTGLRVPFSLLLSSIPILGLNGVWWSISMSSVFKGTILVILFIFYMKKKKYLPKDNKLSVA